MIAGRRSIVALAVAVAIVAATALLALFTLRSEGFDYQDPFDPLPSPEAQGTGTEVDGAPDSERRLDAFLAFVFSDVQRFWAGTLERSGIDYVPATLIVFRRAVVTSCGPASASRRPVLLRARSHGVPRRGLLPPARGRVPGARRLRPGVRDRRMRWASRAERHRRVRAGHGGDPRRPGRPQRLSIRMELQADCLAGVWAARPTSATCSSAATSTRRSERLPPWATIASSRRRPAGSIPNLDARLVPAAPHVVAARLHGRRSGQLRHLLRRRLTASGHQ